MTTIEPKAHDERILLTPTGEYLGGAGNWRVDAAVADLLERAGFVALAPDSDQRRFAHRCYRSTGKLHDADLCTAIAEARTLVTSSREDQIRKQLLGALEAS
jgi:hypothetical protein